MYEIDYKSIELPIGIRDYFYLYNNSKIFANIHYVFEFPFNPFDRIKSEKNNTYFHLFIEDIALGIGYKFKNMFEVEMRYNTNRELLGYYGYSDKYSTFSIIIGISLF